MSDSNNNSPPQSVEDLVATDTGGRNPSGLALKVITCLAITWSLFQLWIASPLPYIVSVDWLLYNSSEARSIHLAFAVLLAYLSFPALKSSPQHRIPALDWVLACAGAACAAYYFIFYIPISDRVGAPIAQDIIVACIGIPLLLESARRSLGPPLMAIATLFLAYTFWGSHMPEMIAHRGYSLSEIVNHQWITTEGVFGVALGVSTDFIFLFVLFGALLDKAGAGNYFIQVAFSLLGHMRGGPAKAAVVSSGMTGLISGSSIANVVTTGTFTIPMMKKVGFSSDKAGAVEVAASVNGQIMPPVMGAAAFLMVEYVGISYFQVIKHAFLPAAISYIALVYIVHLEALKLNMQGLERAVAAKPFVQKIMLFLMGFLGTAGIGAVVYFGLGWLKPLLGGSAGYVIGLLLVAVYVGLVRYSARYPDLELDDPNNPVMKLPEPGPTFKAGLHYLLPVVVLVWALMVERLSPGLSAFWANLLMIFIILTQRPLFKIFRGETQLHRAVLDGIGDFQDGLIAGAKNMIGIGIATAVAGIIVGAVSQTSVGSVLADVVEVLSMGNISLMLLLVAVLCLILGMGLPTTANYIVVSSLMATVIVDLGAQNGLIVPLVAVHLFVFYFGLMADVTPPVGLAAFAAAAVSGGSPIKTGFISFGYAIRTCVLPFLFIYNTDLLLIDVGIAKGLFVFVVSTIAMLTFAAASQRYFVVKSRFWETALLFLVAFSLFRPDFWMNKIVAPYQTVDTVSAEQALARIPKNALVRFHIDGENEFGDPKSFVSVVAMPGTGEGLQRLENLGMELSSIEGGFEVDSVEIGSAASIAGFDSFQQITTIEVPTKQPPKELIFIPALLLLGMVFLVQRRRSGDRKLDKDCSFVPESDSEQEAVAQSAA